MKIALCFFGLPRLIKKCYPDIFNYFIENNDTQENVCKIFKCSVRSLLRWTERYKDNDEIKRHNRKPIAYKVTKEHVKFIFATTELHKIPATILSRCLKFELKKLSPQDLKPYFSALLSKEQNH
jgi:replication-associated recombination protein RarA